MIQLEIIPLDYENIDVVKEFQFKNMFVTSSKRISKMESKGKGYYHIEKYKAITRIMKFLRMFDDMSPSEHSRNLNPRAKEISSAILCKYLTKDYNTYIAILEDLKIIEQVPFKIDIFGKGVLLDEKEGICHHYQFIDEYENLKDLCFVVIPNKTFGRKQQLHLRNNPKVSKEFQNTIKDTKINIFNAIKEEINAPTSANDKKLRSRLNSIFHFINEDRYISPGIKVDRIYHSMSNMSRESRKHLSINGQSFFNTDIVNCQPMLLCAFLKDKGMPIDQNYIDDCQNGTIYEKIQQGTTFTRTETKIELYQNIFFGFNRFTEINYKFKDLYLNTWKSLNKINREKKKAKREGLPHETLAAGLQNIEAKIFNNLKPISKFYFTLCDAVYFTNILDTNILKKQILDKFAQLDLVPKFKDND